MNKFEYFALMLEKIFTNPLPKFLAGLGIIVLNFLFDGVLKDAMMALFLLCLMDFVTAIHAIRRQPGEMIKSSKIWRTAAKISVYFLLISAGRISEIATSFVIPFLDETILGFLAVTELISILENVGKMGYAVPEKLLKKLSDYRDEK